MLRSAPFPSLDLHDLALHHAGFLRVNAWVRSTPGLHEAVVLFARYGVLLFGVLLVLAWWRARRDPADARVAAALWAPVGVVLAVGLNQPLGRLADAPRPSTVFPHALLLIPGSADSSFPSDHAVMAGAAAAGLLLVDRRLGLVASALAVLMAFSRVYVGAHFPVDVLAGLVVGVAVSLVGWLVLRPALVPAVRLLRRGPLRVLVSTDVRTV